MRSKPRRLGALRGKETEATRRTRINGVHKRLQSLPEAPRSQPLDAGALMPARCR